MMYMYMLCICVQNVTCTLVNTCSIEIYTHHNATFLFKSSLTQNGEIT